MPDDRKVYGCKTFLKTFFKLDNNLVIFIVYFFDHCFIKVTIDKILDNIINCTLGVWLDDLKFFFHTPDLVPNFLSAFSLFVPQTYHSSLLIAIKNLTLKNFDQKI